MRGGSPVNWSYEVGVEIYLRQACPLRMPAIMGRTCFQIPPKECPKLGKEESGNNGNSPHRELSQRSGFSKIMISLTVGNA